jgi:hypothetical protein
MSPQNVATVWSDTGCPKIGQGSGDAVVSPTRVLAYQIHHQLFNLLAKPRPASGPALYRAVKLLRDELPIPGQLCQVEPRRRPAARLAPKPLSDLG